MAPAKEVGASSTEKVDEVEEVQPVEKGKGGRKSKVLEGPVTMADGSEMFVKVLVSNYYVDAAIAKPFGAMGVAAIMHIDEDTIKALVGQIDGSGLSSRIVLGVR